jgi:hypothetical protein
MNDKLAHRTPATESNAISEMNLDFIYKFEVTRMAEIPFPKLDHPHPVIDVARLGQPAIVTTQNCCVM